VIVGISVLVGLLIAYFSFQPDLSVEPYQMLDPDNPFSEQFSVQNNSLYALFSVRAVCRIPDMNVGNGAGTFHNVELGVGVVAQKLSPKDTTTVDCRSTIVGITRVELVVDLTFGTKWWPWDKTISRRFVGKKDYLKRVQWIHEAMPPS
jgi:hypothetical protein